MPRRHVGHVERAGFVGEHGVEDHLVEQVAELVDERDVRGVVGRDIVGRERRQRLDRLDDLVALLEQVARQRVVRLLGVPRAAAGPPEPLREGEQPAELARRRPPAPPGDEDRREVVGVDVAVEVGERRARRRARRGDRRAAAPSPTVSGGRAARAARASRRTRTSGWSHCAISSGAPESSVDGVERTAVDDPGARRQRVDPEARPRGVGERQPGDHRAT